MQAKINKTSIFVIKHNIRRWYFMIHTANWLGKFLENLEMGNRLWNVGVTV